MSEEEDAFDSEALQEMNQLTVTSVSQLSTHPGNDPESMVAFLPHVRRNTMERIPEQPNPRERFVRKNTMERLTASRSPLTSCLTLPGQV